MAEEIGWTEKLAKEWKKYKPPSRPSRSEVHAYEKYFRLMKNKKALILGSTPELRELAAKYDMQTTVCDWSEDVYNALKLLMNARPKETFSKQDWRTMKFDAPFDLIVGDCATTVMPFKDLEAVLQTIASSLAPGGIAVQRIWVRHKNQRYTPKSIVRALEKKKRRHWYTQLLFPVFLRYYNEQAESLSGQALYEKMQADGSMDKRIVKLFSLVRNHKTQNNMLLKKDLEQLLSTYFTVREIAYGRDNFRANAPIYVLGRK